MKTLTFAETLHPEYAADQINPQNKEGTAWGRFVKEVRDDLPSAVAYAVEEDEQTPVYEIDGSSTAEVPPSAETVQQQPNGQACLLLEGLVGGILTIAASAATFGIELSAAICYCLAAGFNRLASGDKPVFLKAILLLIVQALMIADAVTLTVSVLVTEILGGVAFILTACCKNGKVWRVYIRKVSHLTRWVFRGFHDGWELKRVYPIDMLQHQPSVSENSEEGLLPDSEQPQYASNVVAVTHESINGNEKVKGME